MSLWPRSLLSRVVIILLLSVLLANGMTWSLLLYERVVTARSVMLGNLEYDVATSVAILNRVPAQERAVWLERLDRGNYHYLLAAGQPGNYPDQWRSKQTAQSLEQALGGQYPLKINAIADQMEHLQAHLQLSDGTPLTIDIKPQITPIARWLPYLLVAQLVLLLVFSWLAVRLAVKPLTLFTRAAELLRPDKLLVNNMLEEGPEEVRQAAKAFNAMQQRIQQYLKERAHILAAISHDLQTPITRMQLRLEALEQPELKGKLQQDMEEMSNLMREGINFARTSASVEEKNLVISVDSFVDSLVFDYQDVGKNVVLLHNVNCQFTTKPQALRRVLTNLIDNALKFGGTAELTVSLESEHRLSIVVEDNGPGIPAEHLDDVLQPFFRVESSRNRNTGGTGLGLAITAQLVTMLGGQLFLSNRLSGGLQAKVTLTASR